jgi:hypothetical protein
MRLKCNDCGFIANEEIFERSVIVDDAVGKGIHEEGVDVCPKCKSSDVVDYDEFVEMPREDVIKDLTNLAVEQLKRAVHDEDYEYLGSLFTDEKKGYSSFSNEELAAEYNDYFVEEGGEQIVVISDEDYKNKSKNGA